MFRLLLKSILYMLLLHPSYGETEKIWEINNPQFGGSHYSKLKSSNPDYLWITSNSSGVFKLNITTGEYIKTSDRRILVNSNNQADTAIVKDNEGQFDKYSVLVDVNQEHGIKIEASGDLVQIGTKVEFKDSVELSTAVYEWEIKRKNKTIFRSFEPKLSYTFTKDTVYNIHLKRKLNGLEETDMTQISVTLGEPIEINHDEQKSFMSSRSEHDSGTENYIRTNTAEFVRDLHPHNGSFIYGINNSTRERYGKGLTKYTDTENGNVEYKDYLSGETIASFNYCINYKGDRCEIIFDYPVLHAPICSKFRTFGGVNTFFRYYNREQHGVEYSFYTDSGIMKGLESNDYFTDVEGVSLYRIKKGEFNKKLIVLEVDSIDSDVIHHLDTVDSEVININCGNHKLFTYTEGGRLWIQTIDMNGKLLSPTYIIIDRQYSLISAEVANGDFLSFQFQRDGKYYSYRTPWLISSDGIEVRTLELIQVPKSSFPVFGKYSYTLNERGIINIFSDTMPQVSLVPQNSATTNQAIFFEGGLATRPNGNLNIYPDIYNTLGSLEIIRATDDTRAWIKPIPSTVRDYSSSHPLTASYSDGTLTIFGLDGAGQSSHNSQLVVSDISGRLVFRGEMANGKVSLDLAQGQYLVRVGNSTAKLFVR